MEDNNQGKITLKIENLIEEFKNYCNTFMRLKFTAREKINYYTLKLNDLERDYSEKKINIEKEIKELIKPADEAGIIEHFQTFDKISAISGDIVIKLPGKRVKKNDSELIKYLEKNSIEFLEVQYSIRWKEFLSTLTLNDQSQLVDKKGNVVEGVELEPVSGTIEIKLK